MYSNQEARGVSIKKSEIKLDVNGKLQNAYLAAPANGGPGVLVLPSWWGLKPFFKQVCEQLAEEGYTALAPDYYNGQIVQTIDQAKALSEQAESDFDSMKAMVKTAKNYLASIGTAKSIGVLGFSMGAAWAVLTATNEPDVAATILFYGSWSVDFSKTKSKVLGHYAETDEWQTLDEVKEMEQNMRAAGVDVTIYLYPGTAHWFMEADRPEYDAAAASLAWDRTREFLEQQLR